MLSELFKRDFNLFLNSNHTVADFIVFLKSHPETRNILDNQDDDFHFIKEILAKNGYIEI